MRESKRSIAIGRKYSLEEKGWRRWRHEKYKQRVLQSRGRPVQGNLRLVRERQ